MWTWDDLRAWTDLLQAKGNMTRGAKALIEAKCREDQFGNTDAYKEVAFSTMLELFEPAVHERVIATDVDWWHGQLRDKETKRLDYAIRAYRQGGGEVLRTKPRVVVGTIHSGQGWRGRLGDPLPRPLDRRLLAGAGPLRRAPRCRHPPSSSWASPGRASA